jgi:hypothetical protein
MCGDGVAGLPGEAAGGVDDSGFQAARAEVDAQQICRQYA